MAYLSVAARGLSARAKKHIISASHGFSLFELMIAIAVLGILLGVGAPSLSGLIAKYQAKSAAHSFYSTYQFARAEAIKRGRAVRLCGSDDGKTCKEYWRDQLIVFSDHNKDGKADPDELIRSVEFGNKPGTLHNNIAFGHTSIQLKPDGRSSHGGSFIYCNPSAPEHARKVTFFQWGRAYFHRLTYKNGTVKDRYGKTISCRG